MDRVSVLEVNDISKKYGTVTALSNVSLSFAENRIYGLLGRNGAGKTTLLDILTARIFADNGHIKCFGEKVIENGKMLANICYMPEKGLSATDLKVKTILKAGQSFYPKFSSTYADVLCSRFDLNVDQKYQALSKGYESILRIILGLASRAPITIFDEPLLGLDLAARDMFYGELIEDYSQNPRTFIVSTHLIEESIDVFDEVIIINKGDILRQATVEELLSKTFYVSGKADDVDVFVQNLPVLGSETIGHLKFAAVDAVLTDDMRRSGLDFTPVSIRKLFIYMTNQ